MALSRDRSAWRSRRCTADRRRGQPPPDRAGPSDAQPPRRRLSRVTQLPARQRIARSGKGAGRRHRAFIGRGGGRLMAVAYLRFIDAARRDAEELAALMERSGERTLTELMTALGLA